VAPGSGFVPENLLGTAIFALHARDDNTVSVSNSRTVVSGILAAAGESMPNYAAAGTDLSFLVSNPGLEFNQELAASAPPGSMVNFFISRSDLDLVYFEPPEGGHEGLVGYWPQAFDWMFSHSLAVPEPSGAVLASCILLAGISRASMARRKPRPPRRLARPSGRSIEE
jgi:hypothetical protein